MTEDILINVTPQETRIAIVSEGATQELHIERSQTRGLAGNVYLGRVVRVLPGMQSAFVDIGLERAAFLHIDDILEAHQTETPSGKPVPIERMLTDGQSVMVRVIKDPLGTKGARLSTQISIAGRLLVYLPQEKHIGISQRIQDEKERELLKTRVQQFLSEDEKGGFIIRTMAEDASDQDLETDAVFLKKLWRSLKDKAYTTAAPALLYQDLTLSERILRDFVHENTSRILVDSHDEFAKLQEFARIYTPDILDRISCYEGDRPLFDLYNVEEEIQLALSRRVNLKIGRLSDYRPDGSHDNDRRQYRRFRQRTHIRRHDIQDQSRSRPCHCPPVKTSQSGRNHYSRLHRYGQFRTQKCRHGRAQKNNGQ